MRTTDVYSEEVFEKTAWPWAVTQPRDNFSDKNSLFFFGVFSIPVKTGKHFFAPILPNSVSKWIFFGKKTTNFADKTWIFGQEIRISFFKFENPFQLRNSLVLGYVLLNINLSSNNYRYWFWNPNFECLIIYIQLSLS